MPLPVQFAIALLSSLEGSLQQAYLDLAAKLEEAA